MTEATTAARTTTRRGPILVLLVAALFVLSAMTVSVVVSSIIIGGTREDLSFPGSSTLKGSVKPMNETQQGSIILVGPTIIGAKSASSSWLDRFLRQKVKLSPMEVLVAHQEQEDERPPFTSWESRGSGGSRGPIAIFYHIYVPMAPLSAVARAINIVHEQIDAIAASPIALEPVMLYYNLIGNGLAWNETQMQHLCQSKSTYLSCQLLRTYVNASESVTLQALHDFCRRTADDVAQHHYRVTYLHTKGSFHDSVKNTHWRRLLTTAALHPDCIHPPPFPDGDENGNNNEPLSSSSSSSSTTCNLCGLQFVTQFTFFVPGNMFTTHCSYVQKLLPLDQYKILQQQRVKELLLLKLQNQLRNSILPVEQLDYYGLDRYADEHWIGSHPDVIPCDLDPYSDIARIFNGTLPITELAWRRAPRIHGVVGGIGDDRQDIVRNDIDLRRREILLLPGLIHRWWILYRQMPNPTSWIWKFFPDGDFWQQAIATYGAAEAVQKVTAPYRTAVDGRPITTGFRPSSSVHDDKNVQVDQDRDLLLVSERTITSTTNSTSSLRTSAPHVVFYHVVFPDDDPASIARVTRHIVDQWAAITASLSLSSMAPVHLFYSIAGGGTDAHLAHHELIKDKIESSSFCMAAQPFNNSSSSMNNCRFMGSFDDAYEGESLRLLHRYCTLRPVDHVVTYLHNLPPPQWRLFGEDRDNQRLIQNLQRAALSRDCRRSVTASNNASSSPSCNVCGLIFYNVWTHFFPGNMFTARCDYVQKLLPPAEFEIKMNDLVGDVLLMRLRNIFVTRLFPTDRADLFGLHRHALEQWIASHPDLVPCDLSNATQDLNYWTRRRQRRNVTTMHRQEEYDDDADFHWGLAPRHAESAPFFGTTLSLQQQDVSLRLREYHQLPGLIHRWLHLYGQVPALFAWQFMAAPDGLQWLRATHEYGHRAVLEVTAPFAKDTY
jgi:hypothetical protein